jgi:prepilin-type N-terminal cleavage/methylation domain-containing protein
LYNRKTRGFSLIEILTVLLLSTMILTAALLIFGRVRGSVAAINARLEKQAVPDEILQKIAEDIDRLAAPGFDATISIQNKVDTGYNSAQLIIENRYYGNGEPPQSNIYERVVWQSMYDPLFDQMTLYRCHSGLNLEDALVDNMRSGDKNPEIFVPICPGLTFFGVYALADANELAPQWQKQALPKGILVKLSLQPMVQLEDGSFELPEENIVSRAVAVDRTRPITYTLSTKLADYSDPNKSEANDPNKTTTSGGKPAAQTKSSRKTDGKYKKSTTQ